MADLADVERMVDSWERDAVEKSRRYQRMQAEVEQISITESVANGAVSVTVGHNGLPTGVKMTEAVRRMNPDEIAANVLRAIQKAQSRYPERMRAIVAETVGEDGTTRHIVAAAVDAFPPPPEEEQPEPAPEVPRHQLFEQAEDEAPRRRVPPAPKPPSAPMRPPDDDGGGDFSDESFLRRN